VRLVKVYFAAPCDSRDFRKRKHWSRGSVPYAGQWQRQGIVCRDGGVGQPWHARRR
jgi:hypothetical protein